MPSTTRQREIVGFYYGIFRTKASSILGESNLLVLAIYSPSINSKVRTKHPVKAMRVQHPLSTLTTTIY